MNRDRATGPGRTAIYIRSSKLEHAGDRSLSCPGKREGCGGRRFPSAKKNQVVLDAGIIVYRVGVGVIQFHRQIMRYPVIHPEDQGVIAGGAVVAYEACGPVLSEESHVWQQKPLF